MITHNGSAYVPLKFKNQFEFKGPANGMSVINSFHRPLGKHVYIYMMDSSSNVLTPYVDSGGLLINS